MRWLDHPAGREPKLRGLAAELGVEALASVAGFHNLEQSFVMAPFAGQLLVAVHEGVHDELLTTTAFGGVQRIFKRLHARSRDNRVRAVAAQTLEDLVRASRLTHECAATYLSIKWFPSKEEPRLLSAHPNEYKSFYLRYAEVIDRVIAATFVQYLIGKALSQAVMNPAWIYSLCDWTPDRPMNYSPEQRPDTRLHHLLELLSVCLSDLRSSLPAFVDSSRARGDVAGTFDVLSEADWEALGEPASRTVENDVWNEIGRWMYGICRDSLPTLDPTSVAGCVQGALDAVQERVGIQLFDDDDAPSQAQLDLASDGSQDRWGLSLIDNSANATDATLELIPDDVDAAAVLHEPPGPRVFISRSIATGPDEIRWNRLVFIDEARAYGHALSHGLMRKALRARNILAAMGLPESRQAIVVGPLPPLDNRRSVGIYGEVLASHTLGEASHAILIGVDNLIWYMGGSFFRWYDTLLRLGPTKFAMFYPEGSLPRNESQAAEMASGGAGATTWWIFECESLQGLFFKIASAGAGLPIGGAIHKDLASGRIARLGNEEERRAFDLLAFAAKAIFTTWPEF